MRLLCTCSCNTHVALDGISQAKEELAGQLRGEPARPVPLLMHSDETQQMVHNKIAEMTSILSERRQQLARLLLTLSCLYSDNTEPTLPGVRDGELVSHSNALLESIASRKTYT